MAELMPKAFNPAGTYILYSSERRGAVYIQNGHVFAENGEDLEYSYRTDEDRPANENFLSWLNRRGFTMDTDFRRAVTRAKLERDHQARVERSRQEMMRREQEELEAMDRELRRNMKQVVQELPPMPDMTPAPVPDIQLTQLERDAWGTDLSGEAPPLPEPEEDADTLVVSSKPVRKRK